MMRKTILAVLGSALLAASTIPIAAAAEHHKSHRVYPAPAPMSERFRDSNAYYAPAYQPSYVPGYPWGHWTSYSRYQDVPAGPPAGQ
jgi:Spy/CpxP family protein refolding chaperone